ncbi:MAG TPA: hypothetical protein VIF57_28470 [Polyangia bacterium]
MRDGQLADQPQPEPHAAAAFRGRVLMAPEQAQALGRSDPISLIADRDRRARSRRAHRQANRPTLPELQRVGEEIGHDLFDGGRIPPTVEGLGRGNDGDGLGAREGREQPLRGGADRGANVDESRLEQGAPRALQLGHGVNQGLEALHLGADDAESRRYAVDGQPTGVALGDADVEQRGRHRCAQLVPDQLDRFRTANQFS